MSDQQSTRKDGWYWVRVIGANKSEPGKWYSSLQEFAVAGGGFKESELAEIGPRIPSPDEKPSPEARAASDVCSTTGRPWKECDCGNCERGPITRVPAASEPTRGTEGHSERWHALWDVQQIIDSADGDLDFVQHQLEKEIAKASAQPATPQSELRKDTTHAKHVADQLMKENKSELRVTLTREQVNRAVVAGWCKGTADMPMNQVLTHITDEVMRLLEGE